MNYTVKRLYGFYFNPQKIKLYTWFNRYMHVGAYILWSDWFADKHIDLRKLNEK